MKRNSNLALILCLTFMAPTLAMAQGTPDGETPAQEAVCDGLAGAAFGLCNAYCEAMDCDSELAEASPTACERVADNFFKMTGNEMPCEDNGGESAVDCAVGEWSEWSDCDCDGETTRTRSVLVVPDIYGEACPATEESQDCAPPEGCDES